MFAVVVLLLIMAAVIIIGNTTNNAHYFVSVFFMIAVIGVFTVIFEDYAIPLSKLYIPDEIFLIRSLIFTDALFTTIFHYFTPYTLFMFGLYHSGVIKNPSRQKRLFLNLLFMIPTILMYVIFPVQSPYFNPDYNPYFFVIALWSIIYIIAANIMLLSSYLKEKRACVKKEKLIIMILLIPGSTYILLACYILILFNIRGGYRHYLPVVIVEFSAFIILAIKYGVLGIRFKIERYRVDNPLLAMTSGTSIFNHAVKNEMYKISLCISNIRNSSNSLAPERFMENASHNIDIISNATNHLLDMVSKVQERIADIILEEDEYLITELMNECLHNNHTLLENKNIIINKDYEDNYTVYCDKTHIIETFNNIIKNSVEAMSSEGELNISVYKHKKKLVVRISDSGMGIAKSDLPYVFDPFFSTKSRKTNFGLGLCYCLNVMQKHGGLLKIISKENQGTTVLLMFPK